jgi:hypothetical protein
VSAGDGMDWAVIVRFRDSRGGDKEVRVSCGDAVTEPSKCIHDLASGGLLIHVDDPKLFRLVLKAVTHADVPLAYRLVKAGWFPIASTHVFALPSGVIPRVKEEVIWGGDHNYCRALRRGSIDRWRETVLEFANGNWLVMASIGVMLASPAIPFLPAWCETNTTVLLIGPTSTGKTVTLRAAVTSWGEGSPTTSPTSFVEPFKSTSNAIENLLAAHNHVGITLDELKTLDAKAAATAAYDISLGKNKARQSGDGSSRRRTFWELFGLGSGERTLSDRASEVSFRHQPGDAGAEARAIHIEFDVIFEDLHGYASPKLFAEALGAACVENYGFGGPANAEWLAAHRDEARAAIIKNLAAWNAIAALQLGSNPSPQAERVSSRLAPMAAGAALAAETLEFPWSAELPVPEGRSISAPACAMIQAFSRFLDIWLSNNGRAVSTQVNQAFGQLRNYYHGAQPAAFVVAGLKDGGDDKIMKAQSDTVPHLGWKVFRNLVTEVDNFGRERAVSGTLEHVDFKPDVLKQRMGWTEVTLKATLRALRDQGLLLSTKPKELRHRRKMDGKLTPVIRVKAEFFGDEDEEILFA